MSDEILYVFPNDPLWQPTSASAEGSLAIFRRMTGGTDIVEAKVCDDPQMIHPVEYLDPDDVRCPACDALAEDWYMEALAAAYDDGFMGGSFDAPCCHTKVLQRDYLTIWPIGFASFTLSAWNPEPTGEAKLSDGQLAELGEALGHPVRQILSRI